MTSYSTHLVDRAYKHFRPDQKKYHKYNSLAQELDPRTAFLQDMVSIQKNHRCCNILTRMTCS